MNLLLDTHAFIWFVEDDEMLPAEIKKEIEKESNTALVSIATLWEITIKVSLRKLKIRYDLEKLLKQVTENGFEILPILPQHFLTLSELEFHHRDPFDRLLVAQSKYEKLNLVSKDVALDAYGIKRMW